MFNVLVTETLDGAPERWLTERARVTRVSFEKADDVARAIADADGLLVRTYTKVNDALLAKAPRLKVVGRAGVGLDNVDVAACHNRGVQVVYTPDANTQAVVEYIFALIFDAIRPRHTIEKPITAAEFHRLRREHVGTQLDSLTLGILGFGRIGKRVARAAHAMGVKVIVNDVLPEATLRSLVEYPFEFVAKEDLYRRSDVLTIHVDGRASNRLLIGGASLALLKPTCLLINAARGMLIDNAALAAWAKRVAPTGGKAVLDVHEPEPLPEKADAYPLYGLPNVRLLPHLASRTPEAMENMNWVVRDVIAVLEGKTPQYPASEADATE